METTKGLLNRPANKALLDFVLETVRNGAGWEGTPGGKRTKLIPMCAALTEAHQRAFTELLESMPREDSSTLGEAYNRLTAHFEKMQLNSNVVLRPFVRDMVSFYERHRIPLPESMRETTEC